MKKRHLFYTNLTQYFDKGILFVKCVSKEKKTQPDVSVYVFADKFMMN